MTISVCFIDDNLEEVEPFIAAISERGAQVIYSNWNDDGEEIYDFLSRAQSAVVILDLYFDGNLRGPEILGKIQERQPGIPVIVLTQDAENDTYQKAVGDWGASDLYVKEDRDIERLWRRIIAASSRSSRHQQTKERIAALLRSSDVERISDALRLCDEFIAQLDTDDQLSILPFKRSALEKLLASGTRQQTFPMYALLAELKLVCRTLAEYERGLDHATRRAWAVAARHSGDLSDLKELGRRYLESSEVPDDGFDTVIKGMLCAHIADDPDSQGAALVSNLADNASPEEQLWLHYRLVQALSMRGYADVSSVASEIFIERLEALPAERTAAFMDAAFESAGAKHVLDLLIPADRKGRVLGPLVANVIKQRVGDSSTNRGALLRSVQPLRQLAEWPGSAVDRAQLQRVCADLCVQLHIDGNAETQRKELMTIGFSLGLHSLDAIKDLLDVAFEVEPKWGVSVFESLLKQAREQNREEAIVALGKVAAMQQEPLRTASGAPFLLQIGFLLHTLKGFEREAVKLVLTAVNQLLENAAAVPRSERSTMIENQLDALDMIAKGATEEELEAIERAKQVARTQKARLMSEQPVLEGQNLLIVQGGSKSQQQRVCETIREKLGAGCHVADVDEFAKIKSICAQIEGGSYQIVVLISGSTSHAYSDQVKDVAVQLQREGRLLYVELDGRPGPDMIVSALLNKLGYES